ncbi:MULTISPECIES: penicillin-binding protein 2 [Aminobacterium]|uniref:penicillin-binding protein 2 n=1 Tax=Aminobacterium TaxID=81466 RepID=UPI00257E358D|nr:penicillin-binding protein 2 [Aminobacterium sp. UBA4834]
MSNVRGDIDKRLRIWRVVMLCVMGGLVVALYFFQIIHADTYVKLAAGNRLRFIRLAPSRGNIFDRNGAPLAINIRTFDIMGYPLDFGNEDLATCTSAIFCKHGIPLLPEEITAAVKRQYWAPYRVVRIVSNLTLTQMAELLADPEFPSQLFPVPVWRRTYPSGALTANVTGYVSEISEEELRVKREGDYVGGDLVGKSGIEYTYENILRGSPGVEAIEVDARGRRIQEIDFRPPQKGENLYLTLDLGAQRLASDLMKGLRGAVVALDVHTGAVLVLYTAPSYDNNPLAWGVSAREWKSLLNDPERPMMDRSIAGVYPPASTFKSLVALAALSEGEITAKTAYFCGGAFQLGRRTFRCWKRTGHGTLNMKEALKNSCDIFFYQVGIKVGIDNLTKWGQKLGVGELTGIDIPGELSGNRAGREWKEAVVKESWYKGDTVNYSIGQGYLLMTPIQLARMYAVFANGGKLVTPYLNEKSAVVPKDLQISSSYLKLVNDGLQDVVKRGTGWRAGTFSVSVAGKTGTAQNAHGADHALFVGYAPADKPQYVVAVVVEAGEHGSSVAAPISGELLAYLVERQSQSIPRQ